MLRERASLFFLLRVLRCGHTLHLRSAKTVACGSLKSALVHDQPTRIWLRSSFFFSLSYLFLRETSRFELRFSRFTADFHRSVKRKATRYFAGGKTCGTWEGLKSSRVDIIALKERDPEREKKRKRGEGKIQKGCKSRLVFMADEKVRLFAFNIPLLTYIDASR